MASSDTDNLLPVSRDDVRQQREVERGCCAWSRRSALFLVEPVLVLYFFNEFPVDILAQKYVITWFRFRQTFIYHPRSSRTIFTTSFYRWHDSIFFLVLIGKFLTLHSQLTILTVVSPSAFSHLKFVSSCRSVCISFQ